MKFLHNMSVLKKKCINIEKDIQDKRMPLVFCTLCNPTTYVRHILSGDGEHICRTLLKCSGTKLHSETKKLNFLPIHFAAVPAEQTTGHALNPQTRSC